MGTSGKEEIQAELDELQKLAQKTSTSELKDGTWFIRLLQYALGQYTKKVDAQYFTEKYPNLPRDAIVDKCISLAKNYAAIEGGLTAGAYSISVASTIGTGGGASPLTLPTAVVSFITDLFYVTQLQLKLAFDLSVLYEHPIDIEDPEDLYDLIRVAFGVKAGETMQNAALKLTPEATRIGVKTLASGTRLASLKALPVVGKYLLQRNLIKFAIPVIGVPLSSSLNYYFTGSVAKAARRIYRGRAAIREVAEEIADESTDIPLLTLQVIYLVAQVDGVVSGEEASLIQELASLYPESNEVQNFKREFKKTLNLKEKVVLSAIAEQPFEVKELLYNTAVVAASANANIHRKEKRLLKRLANTCGCIYDKDEVNSVSQLFQ